MCTLASKIGFGSVKAAFKKKSQGTGAGLPEGAAVADGAEPAPEVSTGPLIDL
eukprot:SAG31_NODE_2795_length_5082_cov_2.673289_4_plen_53_part_00